MSEPIQECSIAEAKWLRKWVIVNPYNISERMEFDSVHDLAQHLFNSKELILNMVKEREAMQAEVERLRKAGDELYESGSLAGCSECFGLYERLEDALKAWNAAKEGKQP